MPLISADLSEQDRVLQKANTVAVKPNSLRFMIVPMNRATNFSRAPNYFDASPNKGLASKGFASRNNVETVNAEWTTRIYIRQAK